MDDGCWVRCGGSQFGRGVYDSYVCSYNGRGYVSYQCHECKAKDERAAAERAATERAAAERAAAKRAAAERAAAERTAAERAAAERTAAERAAAERAAAERTAAERAATERAAAERAAAERAAAERAAAERAAAERAAAERKSKRAAALKKARSTLLAFSPRGRKSFVSLVDGACREIEDGDCDPASIERDLDAAYTRRLGVALIDCIRAVNTEKAIELLCDPCSPTIACTVLQDLSNFDSVFKSVPICSAVVAATIAHDSAPAIFRRLFDFASGNSGRLRALADSYALIATTGAVATVIAGVERIASAPKSDLALCEFLLCFCEKLPQGDQRAAIGSLMRQRFGNRNAQPFEHWLSQSPLDEHQRRQLSEIVSGLVAGTRLTDEQMARLESLACEIEAPVAAPYFALATLLQRDTSFFSDIDHVMTSYALADPIADLVRLRITAPEDVWARAALARRFVVDSENRSRLLSSDERALLSVDAVLAAINRPAPEPLRPSSETLRAEWEALRQSGQLPACAPMDELLNMIGLETPKRIALSFFRQVLVNRRLKPEQRVPLTLNFTLLGNPGTGKTTVARLFGAILHAAGARSGSQAPTTAASPGAQASTGAPAASAAAASSGARAGAGAPAAGAAAASAPLFVEKTAAELKSDGPAKFSATIDSARGGVLFIDEAYALEPLSDPRGREIVDMILTASENLRDELTIILAGYKGDIETKLYAYNLGLKSRFKDVMFDDFSEDQLGEIWRDFLRKHEWAVEHEQVSLVATRRLARGIGRYGFGNAREVRRLFEASVLEAIARMPTTGAAFESPTLAMLDVVGPPPSRATLPDLDAALRALEALTGLHSVKEAVQRLVDIAAANYDRELRGEKPLQFALNRLFIGNPGTGKTTVAKIYGRILKALRLLSDGTVEAKTASDFIGAAVGETATKTAGILGNCEGKVLLIDEAYVLDDNLYGKQALDTIVEKVLGAPGENIAVIMCGYDEPILKMLRDQNPGLSSRFDPTNAIRFEDYSDSELAHVFVSICAAERLGVPPAVRIRALKRLGRRRALPNFGNARAVTTLLSAAKAKAMGRLGPAASGPLALVTGDFETAAEAAAESEPMAPLTGLRKIDRIRGELESLLATCEVARREGRPLPTLGSYVFLGRAGTGKTTVARTMAAVLHSVGLLAGNHCVETAASELKGAYVGHAQEHVRKRMADARGGVLFIDEAYELGSNQFGEEALAELIRQMTLPEHLGKTVVILAGYEANMREMMARNPGTTSRFRNVWSFEDWSSDDCAGHVFQKAADGGFAMDASGAALHAVRDGFRTLIGRPGWANARDADTVFAELVGARALRVRFSPETTPSIVFDDVERVMAQMLRSRPEGESRAEMSQAKAQAVMATMADPRHNAPQRHNETQRQARQPASGRDPVDAGDSIGEPAAGAPALATAEQERAFWADAASRAEAEAQTQFFRDEAERLEREARERAEAARRAAEEAARIAAELAAAEAAERERLEAEQQRAEEARRVAEKRAAEAQRRAEAAAQEQRVQTRIRQMGVCPQGFAWLNRGTGYQCAGGSHWLSNADLGI